MIKVYVLYGNKTIDLTPFLKSVSISGDKEQIARRLEVTIHYSIWDKNHSTVQVAPGSKAWVLFGNTQIFYGIVWDRELNSTEELVFTAFDYLIYLQQSAVTYNFKNILVESGIRTILNNLGLPIRSIVSTGVKTSRILQNKTGYEAVMELLTQASKINRKQYILLNDRKETSVIEKGKVVTDFIVKSSNKEEMDCNVINTNYKDTMSNMVNRVMIYDDKNNYIGKVDNPSTFGYFGIIQKSYQKEKDKNYNIVAQNMLHGIDKTVNIECLGNWSCRTGFAVKTQIFYLNNLQNKVMYIDADTHTWEVATNKYTMQLTLSYENKMDIKEE